MAMIRHNVTKNRSILFIIPDTNVRIIVLATDSKNITCDKNKSFVFWFTFVPFDFYYGGSIAP